MINARINPATGGLILTADNQSRAELAEAARRYGYPGAEQVVAEGLHESYEFIGADDIPYALTDAPFLVDCDGLAYPDNGETVLYPDAKAFWFPDYCVMDPWEMLRRRGRVEFASAGTPAAVEPDRADPVADYLPPAAPVTPAAEFADYMPGGAKAGLAFVVPDGVTVADMPDGFRSQYEAADDSVIPGAYVYGSRDGRFGPYQPSTFKGRMNLERDSGGRFAAEVR